MIKYSGTGNTFLIMMGDKYRSIQRPQLVQRICSPIFGVCADGALFLDPCDSRAHWAWDFYNSDGTKAEMCGNASRCATQFVYEELKHEQSSVVFKTPAGVIVCCRKNQQYEVLMPPFQVTLPQATLGLSSGTEVQGVFLNTGVPHFVIEASPDQDLGQKECLNALRKIGSEIRNHMNFQPQGTNATFFKMLTPNSIRVVSFERGVEDFTLACGTGAVAAAVAVNLRNQESEILVKMPGGEISVQVQPKNKAIMIGSSEKIAEIKWMGKV